MGGKVNGVMGEVMNEIWYKVMGKEVCVGMSGEGGEMEVNGMEGVMGECCFECGDLVMKGLDRVGRVCMEGIRGNEEVWGRYVEDRMGVVRGVNGVMGYKNCRKIGKEGVGRGKGVYEVVVEEKIVWKEDLDSMVKGEKMIKGVKLEIKGNM